MRRAFLTSLLVGGALFASSVAAGRDIGAKSKISYSLRYQPPEAGEPAYWVVEVKLAKLPRRGELSYRLSEWGGWAEAYPDYLEIIRASPPLVEPPPEAGFFPVASQERRGSSAHLVYRLQLTEQGSELQQRIGLLPTWSEDYAWGYTWNTLVTVQLDDEPLAAEIEISLEAPKGTHIVTGWAGKTAGHQTVDLTPEMGNAPIAFGMPGVERIEQRGGFAVEVFQFGNGPNVTETVADVLTICGPAFEEAFGFPARQPYRAFITDHQGGGMGSHFGLRIGVTAAEPDEHARSPWLRHHIAHELLHDWLGIELQEDSPRLVWFKEGFVEYLSLWQAAASGLVSREYFAKRWLEFEGILADRGAKGVSYADPNVVWRDGDGPNETLAYVGAPLLALRLDAELRTAGMPGLPQLLRDLLAREDHTYSFDDLREWLLANGLEQEYERHVKGTALPDVTRSLALAGYTYVEEPADLTYFGLRTEGNWPGARVLAVDPEGPAARAGILAGDTLTGWCCLRKQAPTVQEGYVTEYPFGLAIFEPGVDGTFLGVAREGLNTKTFVDPVILEDRGVYRRLSFDGETLDRFFAFKPER